MPLYSNGSIFKFLFYFTLIYYYHFYIIHHNSSLSFFILSIPILYPIIKQIHLFVSLTNHVCFTPFDLDSTFFLICHCIHFLVFAHLFFCSMGLTIFLLSTPSHVFPNLLSWLSISLTHFLPPLSKLRVPFPISFILYFFTLLSRWIFETHY